MFTPQDCCDQPEDSGPLASRNRKRAPLATPQAAPQVGVGYPGVPFRADLSIRWCIRRDMNEVLAIESLSFPHPWSEDDFIRVLRNRNAIGMVCEHIPSQKNVGFMVYELHRNRLHVLNFAVHPEHRRTGVGAAMIQKLRNKLSPDRRSRIMLEIHENNLDAQLFFARQGFRAVSVLRNFYAEHAGDAYQFLLRYSQ